MHRGIRSHKGFPWGVLPAAMVALILVAGCSPSEDHTARPQSGGLSVPLRERRLAPAPSFRLTERSGKEITSADLRGKVWIADFIFTRCVDVCPVMSAQMARLQSEFSDEPGLKLVSISVDPEHDRPAILARYATQFHADPERWYFLTGDKKAIYRLVREGFKLAIHDPDDPQASREPASGARPQAVPQTLRPWIQPEAVWAHDGETRRQPVIHSDRFVLVDDEGWIRGYYHGSDVNALAELRQDVRELLRMRKTP